MMKKKNKQPITIKLNKNDNLEIGTDNLKNFGYSALSKIYHELEIDEFIIKNLRIEMLQNIKLVIY